MGTLSGDDYYQQRDEDAYYDSYEFRGENREVRVPLATPSEKDDMRSRYAKNKAAKVGDKIACACCGKALVKKNYQQAFCPPTGKGKGKRYKCKDKYWNLTDSKRASRANLYC